jgi:hypothetical protein
MPIAKAAHAGMAAPHAAALLEREAEQAITGAKGSRVPKARS